MMQDQLDRSRAETDGIRQMKEKVEGILEGLSQAKLAETEEEKVETTEEWREEEEGRDIWEELQRQFG
jgi:mediator of RNA polymerase II transcription subunit 7